GSRARRQGGADFREVRCFAADSTVLPDHTCAGAAATREPSRESPKSREPMYGELVPLGGGDAIPLLKKKLVIGRRENCDIVLRFPNISARHCELTLTQG